MCISLYIVAAHKSLCACLLMEGIPSLDEVSVVDVVEAVLNKSRMCLEMAHYLYETAEYKVKGREGVSEG